jgi:Rrf2 family iron-sulfur cluster assembly transcriptional regulator
MILTTKSRYAVASIVDIAICNKKDPINLHEISLRQNISINYLEQIFCKLKNAGLVNAFKGPGGGYTLARSVGQISIKHIIDAVEESLEMTKCGNDKHKRCLKQSAKCFTHDLWQNLGDQIALYLSGISIKDVIENNLISKTF